MRCQDVRLDLVDVYHKKAGIANSISGLLRKSASLVSIHAKSRLWLAGVRPSPPDYPRWFAPGSVVFSHLNCLSTAAAKELNGYWGQLVSRKNPCKNVYFGNGFVAVCAGSANRRRMFSIIVRWPDTSTKTSDDARTASVSQQCPFVQLKNAISANVALNDLIEFLDPSGEWPRTS